MKLNLAALLTRKPNEKVHLLLTMLLLIGSITSSLASDYYFSSSSGDDNRSSSQAQNSATPWRSIDKLNTVSYELKAGDRILFKSEDTFYGSIIITRGGSPGNPITYTSYGSGEKPVITSMVRVSNWVSRGGGIYEAALSVMDGGSVQIFSINDQIKEFGRYPNSGSSNDGYLTISSVNSSLSIQGENLPTNLVGGEIVIRKNNWIIDRHQISYNSGSTVNFLASSNTVYYPQRTLGYFVQNHINTLDQSGEWAYSKSDKMLYGYFGSQNPNSLNVQVATRDNLIRINKYIKDISFNNLSLKGSNSNLIHIENSGNIQITNNQLLFAGDNAVYANATPDMVVRNNSIDYSLSGALFFQFGTPRVIIEDNIIDHTMPFQGMASSSDLKGEAIYIAADANNSQITRNRIYNTGFNGIHFGGNYTVIKNNLIDTYCLYKQDGGGIYTNSDGLTGMNNTGREIVGNIILRGIGAVAGSNVNYKLAEGIYIDDNAMGIKIHKNTISEISAKGLYIHNNKNIEIIDNLFYKTPLQLQITHDALGTPVRNVRVEGNQFSSVYDNELPYAIASSDNDINQIGVSNNNYFLDPYGVDLVLRSQSPKDGVLGQKRSLKNWISEFGFDRNSIKPDFNLEKYVVKSSNTIRENDFNSNLSIVSGVYNAVSELSSGISGGSWKISPSTYTKGSAYIQIGSVSSGDQILVEFDTKSVSPDQTIEVLLEKTFNQNQDGTIFNFVTSGDVKKVKLLLKANVSNGNESIVFRFPQTIQNMLIDNLKISKVIVEPINTQEQIFFQYNFSNNVVSYPLSGTFKSGKGEVFTGSVNIPAYGSVLLAKIADGPASSNQAPTITITEPFQNQEFAFGDNILIKANAADPDGEVKRVEFYADNVLIGNSTTAPYQYSWKNASIGNHTVKAKVYDAADLSTESNVVSIKVLNGPSEGIINPDNLAPSVSIISPSQNAIFSTGQDVTVTANASDPEGKIAKVEFFFGDEIIALVTSAPYQVIWKNAPLGTHNLKTKVFDDKGLTAESSRITVSVKASSVENQAPSVSITSPSQNAMFSGGQDITVIANASDPEGKIAKVEFFYGDEMIGLVTSAPYQVIWKKAPLGTHNLKTKVFDDKGLTAESSRITVSVKASSVENQAPSVSITSPAQNASFFLEQDIIVNANASDPENKIEKVEFFYGDEMIGIVTNAPFQVFWQNAPLGTHILKTKVFDDKGLTAESSRISITVKSTVTANQAPSISIVTPWRNQSFVVGQSVTIKTNPSDPENKIAKVEFFANETLIGIKNSAPYEITVNNAPLGAYIIKTKVFDQEGLTAESTRISVIVVNNWGAKTSGSTMALVSPIENQQFESSDTISIEVGSGMLESSYDSLVVFVGEVKQGTSQTLFYDLDANPLEAGINVIKVKAFQSGVEIAVDSVQVEVLSLTKVANTNSYDTFGEQEYTFEIGPNPTSDVLNIYLQKMYKGEDVEIQIYSIEGNSLKVIETNTDIEKITIDVSGYSSGIYFIRIMGKVFVYETKRFIKN